MIAAIRSGWQRGPHFLRLVGAHLEMDLRQARFGAAVPLALALAMPIAALLAFPAPEVGSGQVELRGGAALPSLGVLVVYMVALLVPETIWRRLPPGKREVLDAMPVGRRRNRLARAVAGSALPTFCGAAFLASAAILSARGYQVFELPWTALGAAGLALIAAYALGTIYALLWERVGFLLIVSVLGPLVAPLALEPRLPAASAALKAMVEHNLSPFRVVAFPVWGAPPELAPALLWTVLLCGGAAALAGRYDRG